MHLSLLFLPPLRPFFVYCSVHPSSAGCHPQSARTWLAAGSMLPLVSFPVSPCLGVCPPDLCGWRYLAWVWVGGVGDGAPPMFLLSSMRCRHTGRVSSALLKPLDYLGARLCLPPPPPPFPVKPYLSRYPPDQQESIFVVAPLALSPSVPPGLRPVDLLNAVRAPFHVYPPHYYAMLVVHSHPNPKRAFSGDQRSVGEPAPWARTTGPRLPWFLTTGPIFSRLCNVILSFTELSPDFVDKWNYFYSTKW